MVYDCFTFFNELDLLEIRLHTLNDVVDRFVIAEATRTYSGKPKELIFQKNRERFKKFAEKIVYIAVDDLMSEEEIAKDNYNLPWVNENRQRNSLIKALYNIAQTDVIIVSDLDEIPRPEKVSMAVELAKRGEIVRFEQALYVYYLNFKDYRNPYWYLGSIALSWKTFCESDRLNAVKCDRYTVKSECEGRVIQKVRFLKPTKILRQAGWHFTYMGGAKKIREKIISFSHQEALVSINSVEKRLSEGLNVLNGRRDSFAVRLDENVFPAYVINNRHRYEDFIFMLSDEYLRATCRDRFIARIRGSVYRFIVRLMPAWAERWLVPLRQKLNFN